MAGITGGVDMANPDQQVNYLAGMTITSNHENLIDVLVFARFKQPINWYEQVWSDNNKGLFVVPLSVYTDKRNQLINGDFDVITEIQLVKKRPASLRAFPTQ